MSAAIIVDERVERTWSFVADYWHDQWKLVHGDQLTFSRIDEQPENILDLIPPDVEQLVILGSEISNEELGSLAKLKQLVVMPKPYRSGGEAIDAYCEQRGIQSIVHRSEGFWGQSVAEFGLALTLCGLRRIPQTHARIVDSHEDWKYGPEKGAPNVRCGQFGDDPNFTNGTLCGKRVRIVGAGNIASRYASWCSNMGAEVKVWDPYASEPCFHRAGSTRVHRLEQLIDGAEIFVPMVPLMEQTKGLVTGPMIERLPKGCLVVQVTRSGICDTDVLYRRVLNNELALAADVFDAERF